ncbi:MAG: alpha/beta hydrolase [Pseudomonadota bacterium]
MFGWKQRKGFLAGPESQKVGGGRGARDRRVRVANDLELFCIDRGEGPALVLLPGMTFSGELFEAQVEAFSADHRVIVPDPRSHGRSTLTAHGNDYPQHGQDLAALFDALGLEDVALVGWSFGALSAWSYVDQFGMDRLRAFVCVDTPPVPMSPTDDPTDWAEGPVAELKGGYHAILTEEGQRAFMGDYTKHVMVQRDLSEAELQWIVGLAMRSPPSVLKDLYASGLFSDYLAVARAIAEARPTLFILAEHWADLASSYLDAHIPKAEQVVLGGHRMFWEYPDAFNELLTDFLKRASA